jgi:hypothetical protein
MVSNRPQIVRADAQPGLLIFRQTDGKVTLDFYFNNGKSPITLPAINLDKMTINRGVIAEDNQTRLHTNGFLVIESGR